MIARLWRGHTTAANADAYQLHFTQQVLPGLAAIEGHRGAWLLRRQTADGVEFIAVTLWASIEVIRRFAGSDIDAAVVEPEARAILASFDVVAQHFEVVHGCSD